MTNPKERLRWRLKAVKLSQHALRDELVGTVDKERSLVCPKRVIFTGAQPKAGTGHKMQTVSFFQRYIVRDISLTEIYRWLIEILSAILKSTRHGGQSRERL